MAARAGTSESVVLRIALDQGLEAMETILGAQASNQLGAYVGVARIKWRSYLAQMPRRDERLSEVACFQAAKLPGELPAAPELQTRHPACRLRCVVLQIRDL